MREEPLINPAYIAADFEHSRGRDTAEDFIRVEAERTAMAEAIHSDGAWHI